MRPSIVIPTFNAERTILEQLEAIAAQRWPDDLEIVISDNGSSDTTLSLIAIAGATLPGVRVVDSSDVRGVSHARNVGATVATGDHLLFCDQDDVVGEGWLAAMTAALEVSPFVAARLEHDRLNTSWTQAAYRRPQEWGLAGAGSGFLPYGWGTSLGVRRDLHMAIGGYDESFRQGGEDNDYCYRMQLAGHPLIFVPTAVVHYRHRRGLRDIFRQSRGYGRETQRLLARYGPLGLRGQSPVRLGVSWLALVAGLLIELPRRSGRVRWFSRAGFLIGRLETGLRRARAISV